jgi:hypothetical protein
VQRRHEAFGRRRHQPGPDLTGPGHPPGHPGVDLRQDTGPHDARDVDPRRRPAEVEDRDGERRVLRDGDLVHRARRIQGLARGAPDEARDRRRGGHREAADTGRLGDGGVADVGVGVVGSVIAEEQPLGDERRAREPAVAGPRGLDAEVGAVAGHDGHDGAAGDSGGGRRGELARGHDQVEEEVVVPGDEPHHGGQIGGRSPGLDQIGQQIAEEHERPGPVPVVALVAHMEHLSDDRLEIDRPVPTNGRLEHRPKRRRHPPQPLDHLRAVSAVP